MKPRRTARGRESFNKKGRELAKEAKRKEKAARALTRNLAKASEATPAKKQPTIPHPATIFKHVQLVNLYRKGVTASSMERIIWNAIMSMRTLNPKVTTPLAPHVQEKMCESIFGSKTIPAFVHEMRSRNIRPEYIKRHILTYSLLMHGVGYHELRESGFTKEEIIAAYEETPDYLKNIHAKRK